MFSTKNMLRNLSRTGYAFLALSEEQGGSQRHNPRPHPNIWGVPSALPGKIQNWRSFVQLLRNFQEYIFYLNRNFILHYLQTYEAICQQKSLYCAKTHEGFRILCFLSTDDWGATLFNAVPNASDGGLFSSTKTSPSALSKELLGLAAACRCTVVSQSNDFNVRVETIFNKWKHLYSILSLLLLAAVYNNWVGRLVDMNFN